jgi:hypothetical protein
VYRGKPGCGKGVHLTSLQILMGSDLYFETNKAQQDVFGNHATAFDCNKLVAMNESSMKYNAENKQILLSLITDTKGILINPKGVQSYKVRNLAGTIMMSNDEVVVYVDEDDRRFVVFKTGEKYRNDQVYFAEYEKYMLKPENQRAIYDFLMKRDISEVDWVKDRPKTKAYIKMRNSSLSPCLKWFVDFIDSIFTAVRDKVRFVDDDRVSALTGVPILVLDYDVDFDVSSDERVKQSYQKLVENFVSYVRERRNRQCSE